MSFMCMSNDSVAGLRSDWARLLQCTIYRLQVMFLAGRTRFYSIILAFATLISFLWSLTKFIMTLRDVVRWVYKKLLHWAWSLFIILIGM